MPMTLETLEGRLLAQRKLLARIVAEMNNPAVNAFLDERDHVQAHEEDPGGVPDDGFAVQAALSDELRLLRDEAARLGR